jgi:hypothetical protein
MKPLVLLNVVLDGLAAEAVTDPAKVRVVTIKLNAVPIPT